MNRDVDDVLSEAGARWRASQPSPPEPDLERITRPHRSKRWVPVLAAASVAAIAAATLVVLPDEPAPPAAVAPGKEHPLLVREGDQVQVDGQVVAAPGAPVYYCLPVVVPLPEVLGKPKPPACFPGAQIEVLGVDVDALAGLTTILGVKTGSARLIGTWAGGKLTVEQQSPPPSPTPPAPSGGVPCAAPAGGWTMEDASTAITSAVEAYVESRSDQLQRPWIGWPEGYPTEPSPGAPPNRPSVVMVGVAHGDLERVRRELDPLVAGNLCVTRVRFSQDEVKAQRAAVAKLPADSLHITGVGSQSGDKPVTVSLRILDEQAAAAFRPIGLDKLTFDPVIRPAP